MDYGEEPYQCCLRELQEETGLIGKSTQLIGVYGNPNRDPRKHVISLFHYVEVSDLSTLAAADDAAHAEFFSLEKVLNGSEPLAFDHKILLTDLKTFLEKNGILSTN